LQNLIDYRRQGRGNYEIAAVVSSSSAAAGLGFADAAQIPTQVISFAGPDQARRQAADQVFDLCRTLAIDLVVLAGFLKHLQIPPDFEDRVINIHPSLIPAFCGQGFYGMKVHQAVLDYGCQVTGCTAHFVDNHYDHGPIIAQCPVAVSPTDDASTLQRRVFAAECELYPTVINAFLDGRLHRVGRRVRMLPDQNTGSH
jgi:phosphoribosylglycinamide formyltransferase-1